MLYNPTSQDEGLDTDAPEVDWDNVDWDCATDDGGEGAQQPLPPPKPPLQQRARTRLRLLPARLCCRNVIRSEN